MEQLFQRAPEKRDRYVALIRFLYFLSMYFGVSLVAGIAVFTDMHLTHVKKLPQETLNFVTLPILAIGVLIATYLMSRITKEPLAHFGPGGRHKLRNFAVGLLAGIALMAVVLGAMQAMGGFTFGGLAEGGPALLQYGALYGLVFLCVAIHEEFAFRGFGLVMLSRILSFWPAAILLSVLFGAAHLGNTGEDIPGVVQAGLFGFGLAISFRWTGSLWYALGLHAGWDYAESFIFGVPDSGLVLPGTAMHPVFHGPVWLTGGSVGPEGSVLGIIPLVMIVVIAWFLRERRS